MRRKYLVGIAAAVAVLMLVATVLVVHRGDGGGGRQPSGATSPAVPSPDPLASSRQAAFEKEVEAKRRAAQQRLAAIEARVKAEPTLERQLSLIITEYCRLPAPRLRMDSDADLASLLEKLYDQHWQAGTGWNSPLRSAAMQQGACPDVFSDPNPPFRG